MKIVKLTENDLYILLEMVDAKIDFHKMVTTYSTDTDFDIPLRYVEKARRKIDVLVKLKAKLV